MTTADYSGMTGREIRARCRAGKLDRPTTRTALGYLQANLVVVTARLAADFKEFCRLNPKPCPLLEVLPPGRYEPTVLAPGADLRTDLPRYRVYRDGVCVATPTDILSEWTDDLVAMLIGCSFTFESALLQEGLPVRHVEEGCNVPMYRTNIPCRSAGPFGGPLVVSMRPMTRKQAAEAERVTSHYERVHGGPIQLGEAEGIGIDDLAQPDYGDAVTIRPDEIPVFWACGVTPMEAVMRAKPDLAITHEPGHM
ncbi:MAG: putative hydro-lyase, partial [Planctomycetota bacterium]